MNFVSLMRDVLARIVVVREELEVGAVGEAAAILHDLEIDLAGGLATIGDDIVRVTLDDFNAITSEAA